MCVRDAEMANLLLKLFALEERGEAVGPSGNMRLLGCCEGVGCARRLLCLNMVPDCCHGFCQEGAVLLAMAGGLVVLAKNHSLFSWSALPTMRWLDYVLHDAAGSCDVGRW